jgi:hypothetical protein
MYILIKKIVSADNSPRILEISAYFTRVFLSSRAIQKRPWARGCSFDCGKDRSTSSSYIIAQWLCVATQLDKDDLFHPAMDQQSVPCRNHDRLCKKTDFGNKIFCIEICRYESSLGSFWKEVDIHSRKLIFHLPSCIIARVIFGT